MRPVVDNTEVTRMQVSGVGTSAVYAAAMKAPAAQVNPELNQAATKAAAQASAAMFGLVSAASGAAESVRNIAAGQLSDAVDIQA